MSITEIIEAIRVASYEHPMAHSHSEWSRRIQNILTEAFMDMPLSRRHDMRRDPAMEMEVRNDVPYDERSPGHLVHWNGSLIASWDRAFFAAATKAVLEHYEQERATDLSAEAPEGGPAT